MGIIGRLGDRMGSEHQAIIHAPHMANHCAESRDLKCFLRSLSVADSEVFFRFPNSTPANPTREARKLRARAWLYDSPRFGDNRAP